MKNILSVPLIFPPRLCVESGLRKWRSRAARRPIGGDSEFRTAAGEVRDDSFFTIMKTNVVLHS